MSAIPDYSAGIWSPTALVWTAQLNKEAIIVSEVFRNTSFSVLILVFTAVRLFIYTSCKIMSLQLKVDYQININSSESVLDRLDFVLGNLKA